MLSSAKKNKPEKIVGILGGMGPYATIDFFKQIIILTQAKKDWEHLRILIDNNVKIPSRTRAVLYQEKSPAPAMIESINKLAQIGADFVVVPCNSAHYFYKKVAPSIKIPWLNMIEIVSRAMPTRQPLILGAYITVIKKIYSQYIKGAIYLSDSENQFVADLIEETKLTSHLSLKNKKRLETIIYEKKSEIDSILLSCSELSIVYKNSHIYGLPIIDSALEYAKATIKFAFNQPL